MKYDDMQRCLFRKMYKIIIVLFSLPAAKYRYNDYVAVNLKQFQMRSTRKSFVFLAEMNSKALKFQFGLFIWCYLVSCLVVTAVSEDTPWKNKHNFDNIFNFVTK